MAMLGGVSALTGILLLLNLALPLGALNGYVDPSRMAGYVSNTSGVDQLVASTAALRFVRAKSAVPATVRIESVVLDQLPREPAVFARSARGTLDGAPFADDDDVRPVACRAWPGWPGWRGDVQAEKRASATAGQFYALAPGPGAGQELRSAPLWSATLTVGSRTDPVPVSGYAIALGLGSISSSGVVQERSHFAVLSALQREDGFVLELGGVDPLPGGFRLEMQSARGVRMGRFSTCDSIQMSGGGRQQFFWPNARLPWSPHEEIRVAMTPLRSDVDSSEVTGTRDRRVARFEGAPSFHTGEAFGVRLRIANREGSGSATLHAGQLRVRAGHVSNVRPVTGQDDLWQMDVHPDGRQSVAVELLDRVHCAAGSGSCGSRVQAAARVIVQGPPIDYRIVGIPAHHSGKDRVVVQIEFSEPLQASVRSLERRALDTNGTPLTGIRAAPGSSNRLEVILAPDSADDVKISLEPAQVCTGSGAGCLDDLGRLAGDIDLKIPPAIVYLTFDDGPHPVYTPQILDVLADFDARATFFVTGIGAQRYPELIERIVNEGHTLGNHTWNHESLADISEAAFFESVGATQRLLAEHAISCLKPPNYSVDDQTAERAAKLGLKLVMGTLRTGDWALPGADVLASRIFRGAGPGQIVVLHDGGGDRRQTVSGLRSALLKLRGHRYVYEPLCR